VAIAAAVEPLDGNGNPQSGGRIVLLSIGASNTELIYCWEDPCPSFTFTGQAIADVDVANTTLAIVEGAFGGKSALFWESPDGAEYNRIRDEELLPLGLSEQQVQAVWVYVGDNVPPPSAHIPGANASGLVGQFGNIMRALRSRYPNLRLVFPSSRVYGGYVEGLDRIKEPYSYEHGFAMKWLIQAQIDQMASGGTIVDGRAGDLDYNTVAPWIGWGPYLWADGVNPRSDGLRWTRNDFNFFDGVHLGQSGRTKAAELLLAFFKTSPQARCWFVTGETC
jgi:hypothetical protein